MLYDAVMIHLGFTTLRDRIEEEQNIEAGGAGGRSLAGYEYQIDVSVWLALDLVLANKLAHELILEPATEEDIEADLGEFEPGPVTSTAALDGYRLVVQAKLRTGDAWTVKGVKALLEHGEARIPAASRLKDPCVRYLLVTNAALNGGAAELRVRRAGSWPKASLPATIKNVLPADAAGRVAIIGSEDEERLASDIKELLLESFRVPNARLEACRRALREEARVRMGGAGRGRWGRPELERIIRRFDGYLSTSPELEHYVHPTNWPELLAAMRGRHAALIIGQSGTGKTMATQKLYEELRELVPGLSRVAITHGPEQLRDDRTERPVLYDIEDPWGRYDFDPRNRPWNDQLGHFFGEARHDRMIVATSRLDVAQVAGALDTVKPWLVSLEAEHYGGPERRRLYRTRIDVLPRKLQTLARESEGTVLAELATPLEIQKFFDALPVLDYKGRLNSPGFVAEAIRRAHQNSIERTVIDQVEARGDVRAAAVVWGLLKANGKLSLRLLRQLEEILADHDVKFGRGVSPLVNFFVAARNLRQLETTVTYYHPRVEAGIEQALLRDSLVARRVLRLLIDILVSLDEPGQAWGSGASARLLAALKRVEKLRPDPSPTARAHIDAWLAQELAKGSERFEETLSLAAAAGSADCNAAEAARFLLHRLDLDFPGLMVWRPVQHDVLWYARMQADAGVKAVVETFICDVLPHVRDSYCSRFAAEVGRLASDLTPAFLAAAAKAVHYGVTSSSDAIAEGALKDLEGFEAIVDAAVQELMPSEDESQAAAETRLTIVNGEYSEDYAEHLSNDEDGYTAGEFLEAYVDRVRATVGWRRIAGHRHRGRLLSYWTRALYKDEAPDPEEVAGAFAAVRGTEEEDSVWQVLAKAWDPAFEDALVRRVVEGALHSAVRTAALTCLIKRLPGQLAGITQMLSEQGRQFRLVQLMIEIGVLRHQRSGPDKEEDRESAARAVSALPPLLREISEASFALEAKSTPVLSEQARQFLADIDEASEDVRMFRVNLDGHLQMPLADDVRWLLANSDEAGNAAEAMDAAIRHDMKVEIEAGLSHRFANVVARAVKAFATPLMPPLPPAILALARTKGSPVRRAVLELLDTKPHPDHLPTLLYLAKDEWSRTAAYYGEEDDYPIAQAAVAAISKLGAIDDRAADELYRVAIGSRDSKLRYEIFALLARSAASRFQGDLFDLAVNPGREIVRRAAAHALLMAHEQVPGELLKRITPQLVGTRIESVASRFLLLTSFRGEMEDVLVCAELLATNEKRRVLLLLVI